VFFRRAEDAMTFVSFGARNAQVAVAARSAVSVVFILASVATAAAESLDEIVTTEIQALNEASNLHTQAKVVDAGGITSDPRSGIFFSKAFFTRIQHEANVKQTRGIIRFLLAHEQAHQIQFQTYGVEKMRTGNSDLNRLKECQADMLAAKYLTLSLDEGGDDAAAQRDINEALREMLEVSFNLGDEERDADHPNRQARRTATRLGAARGQLEKLRKLPPGVPDFEYSRRHLEVVLDVRAGESLLDWSLRQSRRIVHYDPAAYRLLSLDKQNINISDKTLPSGTASFDLTYANHGSQSIRVDLEIQCVSTIPADPDDTSRWQKWSVRNFEFILKPGQLHNIRGELEWGTIAGATVPRVIVPVFHDTGLVSCKFAEND
jgi:hypothetical protein